MSTTSGLETRSKLGLRRTIKRVYFRSDIAITLQFNASRSLGDVVQYLRMMDDLFSVMAGNYVDIQGASLRIAEDEPNEELERQSFALSGYGSGQEAADFVHWHDTLATKALDADWGALVSSFEAVWRRNPIAFKWFRSSQVNKRYLEEKFSYAVRLAERYFRSETFADPDAEHLLRSIRQRLDGSTTLEELVERRIAPMLAGSPSLLTTIRSVFDRYVEIAAFSSIRPRDVVRLRGREMHGADDHYSAEEYRIMHTAYGALMLAFRFSALEECGFLRSDLARRAAQSKFSRHLVTVSEGPA